MQFNQMENSEAFQNYFEEEQNLNEPTFGVSTGNYRHKKKSGIYNQLDEEIEEIEMLSQGKNNKTIREESKKSIPKKKEKILYPDIGIKNGYIGTYTKDDNGFKFNDVAKEIKINCIKSNLDSGEIYYEIEFEYSGKVVKTDIQREMLTKNKIIKLNSLGADVFEHNSTIIIKHLINEEQRAPKINVHHEIGWGELEGKEVFKYSKAIGTESSYIGDLEMEAKGTLQEWKDIVGDEVVGHTPLETAIILGLSAVVVGYIAKEIGTDCLVVHFYGDSTQGKSTACQLAISTAGYPDTKKNGLMSTWSATTNGVMGILRGNKGIPVLLDEASMSDIKDFTNAIYMLAGGREKSRMTKELKLREVGTWNTTILSNGEHSLTVKANQNIGIKMRLAEFGSINWTKSAKNAEIIKEGVLKNYGHAAPIIAEKLLELGKEEVIKRWRRCKEDCLKQMDESDRFAPRIAIKLGMIMVTAEIAEEALGLGLNIEKIRQFILENEKISGVQRDIFENAYNYFVEQVNIHKNNFSSEHEGMGDSFSPAKLDSWGKVEYLRGKGEKDKKIQIVVAVSVFNKILKEGGFEDPKIILRKWKKDGILNCEKDRLTRKRKIDITGYPIDVYVIIVKDETDKKETKKNEVTECNSFEELK